MGFVNDVTIKVKIILRIKNKMETSNTYNANQQLEFRQIILSHIKQILALSLRVNSDGENLSLYISSVETLADVLIPFYDKSIETEVEQFENGLQNIIKENNEKLKALNPSEYSKTYRWLFEARRKQAYRILFRKLNLLLKRNDYLREATYGESSEEIVDEGGEANEEP